MRIPIALLFFTLATCCAAQSPEETTNRFFQAVAKSDKKAVIAIVEETSASRIGKSIIAASPLLHKRGEMRFFEGIFERVPTPAEIAAMTPLEAFAEYICDPPNEDPAHKSRRVILGVVSEDNELAHVVYRVEGMPNLGEKRWDMVTCVLQDGEWRVVVSSQVWESYMNYMLQPAMARFSNGDAEEANAAIPGPQSRGNGSSSTPP